jgi:hypothetical protein
MNSGVGHDVGLKKMIGKVFGEISWKICLSEGEVMKKIRVPETDLSLVMYENTPELVQLTATKAETRLNCRSLKVLTD